MYGHAGVAGAVSALGTTATVATLPFTGVSLVWMSLAGFALISAGLAILRTVPRAQA